MSQRSGFLSSGIRQGLVDLMSRDASAAGRHTLARCLTVRGSPLSLIVRLNQQPLGEFCYCLKPHTHVCGTHSVHLLAGGSVAPALTTLPLSATRVSGVELVPLLLYRRLRR